MQKLEFCKISHKIIFHKLVFFGVYWHLTSLCSKLKKHRAKSEELNLKNTIKGTIKFNRSLFVHERKCFMRIFLKSVSIAFFDDSEHR